MKERDLVWIKKVFQEAAGHFVDRIFGDDPKLASPLAWEAQRLEEGVKAGILDVKGSVIALSDGREYNLFTFNREYLPHIAEYVRLIIHDGYKPHNVKFEYQSMDIVIFDEDRPLIAIEVKRTSQLGEGLRTAILRLLPDTQIAKTEIEKDAKRKIEILLKVKTPEFRIVTPTSTWRFEVEYPGANQLILNEIY